ncbi:MAG: FmdB family transcriptional regulator [Betaproteobacteria bacterium]|nr:FmdB family transcriptional regulator [Betaproteobacteria bacterium]
MPIYEYRCESCGFQKEFLQKLSDAPLKDCTECGKPTFSKMLTAAGFQLKGSGWYATDFKNPPAKSKEAVKPDAKAAETSAAKVESKTSAEPAKESATKPAEAAPAKPAPAAPVANS